MSFVLKELICKQILLWWNSRLQDSCGHPNSFWKKMRPSGSEIQVYSRKDEKGVASLVFDNDHTCVHIWPKTIGDLIPLKMQPLFSQLFVVSQTTAVYIHHIQQCLKLHFLRVSLNNCTKMNSRTYFWNILWNFQSTIVPHFVILSIIHFYYCITIASTNHPEFFSEALASPFIAVLKMFS